MALLRLPEELVIQICACLCSHCQNPDDFLSADEPCVRENKTTLARLCLTSKRMLALGRPILYHYYSTGNIPPHSFAPDPVYREYVYPSDNLPAFFSTIIRLPSLATHIRYLQLQEVRAHYPPSLLTPQLIRLLYETSNTIGIKTPFSTKHVFDRIHLGTEDIGTLRSRITVHQWFRALAIILTPNTKKLLYRENPLCPATWTELPNQPLPALTSLRFNNATRGCTNDMVPCLLRMAPNLTSLHLTHNMNPNSNGLPKDISLTAPKLRRLVGEGAEIETFRMVMGWCEELRDVEYYCHRFLSQEELLHALSPAKGVLRKLCYMHVAGSPSHCGVDEPFERFPGSRWPGIISSLKEFCQLEELVMDQWAFCFNDLNDYDGVDTERFIALLPESIQSVHFRNVYKSMEAELLQLELAVPHSFPKLRNLKISIADKSRAGYNCEPERREGLEKMRSVEADFADVGVQVKWGVETPYKRPGMAAPAWHGGSRQTTPRP